MSEGIENMNNCHKQTGSVLILVMVFLIVLTLLGTSSMSNSVMELTMSGNQTDIIKLRQRAYSQAEAIMNPIDSNDEKDSEVYNYEKFNANNNCDKAFANKTGYCRRFDTDKDKVVLKTVMGDVVKNIEGKQGFDVQLQQEIQKINGQCVQNKCGTFIWGGRKKPGKATSNETFKTPYSKYKIYSENHREETGSHVTVVMGKLVEVGLKATQQDHFEDN